MSYAAFKPLYIMLVHHFESSLDVKATIVVQGANAGAQQQRCQDIMSRI